MRGGLNGMLSARRLASSAHSEVDLASVVDVSHRTLEGLRRVRSYIASQQSQERVQRHNRFAAWRGDPVGFVAKGLNEHAWSKQKTILESVEQHRFTAVQSCHDVGKTYIAARVVAYFLSAYDAGDVFVVTTAPTYAQVRNLLWREIGRAHSRGGLPGRLNQVEWWMQPEGCPEELVAFGRKPADYDPAAFQGIHQLRVLAVLDEACGVPLALWDALQTIVTNEESRILAIGNPDDPASKFAQVCAPGSGWNVITISAFESPNFTGEPVPDRLRKLLISPLWVEERKREWGETSPLYTAKVMGQFPDISTDGLVPYSKIVQAGHRELKPANDDAVELGADISRFGGDQTVIMKRHGPVFRRVERFSNRDLMYVSGRCVKAINEEKALRIKIDDIGLGGGVTDRLREVKRDTRAEMQAAGRAEKDWPAICHCEIIGVNVSIPLSLSEGGVPEKLDPEGRKANVNFANIRAKLNWALRARFMDDAIDLDPEDLTLIDQASKITYLYTSKGQIQIQSKEDMKKLLGRSPDDWDALVLADADMRAPGAGFLEFYAEQTAAAQADSVSAFTKGLAP